MGTDENQRKVFDFFSSRLDSKAPFTKEEVEALTDWRGQTFDTYWSKQFQPLVVKLDRNSYRVGEVFRRYNDWALFRQHVTQMRRITFTDYQHSEYQIVRIYEFFMPLSNEANLRGTLDALFYRDSIEARLKTIPKPELREQFREHDSEAEVAYIERLCDWLSNHFGGYSIYHVNGRYRAAQLMRREEVCDGTTRYLVDETTAVTRFIFPCTDEDEAELVAFFFHRLFTSAITEVVNGEDEIWMVESGFKNRLHTWRIRD